MKNEEEADEAEKDNEEKYDEAENEWSNSFEQQDTEMTCQEKDTEKEDENTKLDDNSSTTIAIIAESNDEIPFFKAMIDQCEGLVEIQQPPLSRCNKHTKEENTIKRIMML
eukprot:15327796-Ditylum_brightwellii.AAC.1